MSKIQQTVQTYRKVLMLAGCTGLLVTLTGCYGAASCMLSNYVQRSSDAQAGLEAQLSGMKSLKDGEKICEKNQLSLRFYTKSVEDNAHAFKELSEFVAKKRLMSELADTTITQEEFISPTYQMTEDEVRKEAISRLPIYRLYPKLEEFSAIGNQFCALSDDAKVNKSIVHSVQNYIKMSSLRRQMLKRLAEGRELMREPALVKASAAACAGKSAGEGTRVAQSIADQKAGQRPVEALGHSSGSGAPGTSGVGAGGAAGGKN